MWELQHKDGTCCHRDKGDGPASMCQVRSDGLDESLENTSPERKDPQVIKKTKGLWSEGSQGRYFKNEGGVDWVK